MTWKACLLLLAFVATSHATVGENITAEILAQRARESFAIGTPDDPYQVNYEWEGYDGWYNNPAHPEWGGAGERKLLAAQPYSC